MKKIPILAATILVGFASRADSKQLMTVIVTNPLTLERTGEMVEVPVSDVAAKLQLIDTAQITVLGEDGQQVPYQMMYDEEVAFPATMEANGTVTHIIQSGTPDPYSAVARGCHYPKRLDDVAWENGLGGYHTYGPTLQKRSERGLDYGLFTKHSTTGLILGSFYAEELDKERRAKIVELKKTNPKAVAELQNAISYHIGHGYGMNCYVIGPMLGCGTAALMVDNATIYSHRHQTQKILGNDPLRFIVKLEFNPLIVRDDPNMVEARVTTLDAGSYLNKTVVSYANLRETIPMITGIILYEPDDMATADTVNGYITYVNPTTDKGDGNGKMFINAALPSLVREAETVLLPEKGEKELHGGTDGHVLAISEYEPGSEYTYYWGPIWDKAVTKMVDAWNTRVAEYTQRVHTPLTVIY